MTPGAGPRRSPPDDEPHEGEASARGADGDDPRHGPGVRFPPPLLFVGGGALALALHAAVPLPIAAPGAVWRPAAGWLLAGAGLLWAWWGIFTFWRARTAILPHQAAARLVTWGPYRVSRNPMYTGLAAAYLGVALLVNSWWLPLVLPLVLLALVRLVVRREERHLHAAFGAEYAAYRARVRRWL